MKEKYFLLLVSLLCVLTLTASYTTDRHGAGRFQESDIADFLGLDNAVELAMTDVLRTVEEGARIAVVEVYAPGRVYNNSHRIHVRGLIEDYISKLSPRFLIFERDRLDYIIAERGFQSGRGFDEKELQAIAETAAVQYIIEASLVNNSFNMTPHELRIKMLCVETSRLLSSSMDFGISRF
jgi:hypothetical protein